MRVRDLERLLAAHGISAAKLDGITRRLRESGRLPVGGRGTNAPAIGADEVATILIASAGSGKAPEADIRLKKLEELKSAAGHSLRSAVCSYLSGPKRLDDVTQIRVSRTKRHATILFQDGTAEEFLSKEPSRRNERFFVEGVLPGSLLKLVARALEGPLPLNKVSRDEGEADDSA